MTQPISTAPEQIHIIYRQHKKTGLLAAISPDLDGLIVFGRTPEHLCQKLPIAVTSWSRRRLVKTLRMTGRKTVRMKTTAAKWRCHLASFPFQKSLVA